MKLLIVSALLCALMALTSAFELSSGDSEEEGSTSTMEPSGCPSGWTPYKNLCFCYNQTPKTWAEAERICSSLGGHLPSVHDDQDYREIQEMTRPYNFTPTWIGGTDAAQESLWFWSDGTPFRYTHWCPNEPSNDYEQHCLQINYSGAKCWDDLSCTTRLPSVCARKMDQPQN